MATVKAEIVGNTRPHVQGYVDILSSQILFAGPVFPLLLI